LSAQVDGDLAEIERLRARVAELEAEVVRLEAWANKAVAAAQERTYWLDRWHLDLNELMRHRWADRARGAARGLRSIVRALRSLKRRLLT
jgi:hypothetical protein